MEGTTNEDFCEVFEGTFSSSGVDRAGDRIPPEELESLKEQIEENPEKRKFLNNHNQDEVIGRIIDVWTEWDEDDEILFLKGRVGIYTEYQHVAEEIKSGVKSGLSIGGYSYPEISKDEWGERSPDAQVGIPIDEKTSFYRVIKSYDLDFRFKIEKEVAPVDFFEFLVENQDQVIELAKSLCIWYLGRRSSDANIEIPEITFYKKEVEVNIEEVVKNTIISLNKETDENEEIEKEEVENAVEKEIEDAINE